MMLKPVQDSREYRFIKLSNELQTLLVSDASADKAAAAMDVGVGYFCDPPTLPGLAHFLEHMLFLGTEKYPDESSYKAYLSQHGGSCNASTSSENTNYYFSVNHPHLYGALDRFAQFFTGPLFTESATSREMHAVDSEHKKNLENDSRRMIQVVKTRANPAHPFTKFPTGNLDTLLHRPTADGVDVRAALLKFYRAFYSANCMKLCILGREPLDVLQAWVEELFSHVPNYDITRPTFSHVAPLRPSQEIIAVVPVKDLRSISLTWPIPPQHPLYKSKPSRYVSHLVGHEGPGSILSLLKAKGWSDGLEAGQDEIAGHEHSFFKVKVVLTEEGQDHILDIVEVVFQYISILRHTEVQQWIFNEEQNIAATHFRFKDKESPVGFVSTLAYRMHEYPPDDILSGPYLFCEYRPDLIREVIDALTPQNLIMWVLTRRNEGKTDTIEPWYGVPYGVEKIPEESLKAWSEAKATDELHLPSPNPFIPESLDLQPTPDPKPTVPELVRDDALCRVWFKPDTVFGLPKASVLVLIMSNAVYLSPLHLVYAQLLTELVHDTLNEVTYFAEVAGLNFAVYHAHQGIQVTVKGFTDKLPLLLRTVIDAIAKFSINPTRFHIIKDMITRRKRNFVLSAPYEYAPYLSEYALSHPFWHVNQHLTALEDATPEGLQLFATSLLRRAFIEALVNGNVSLQGSLALVEDVLTQLRCSSLSHAELPERRTVQLLPGVDVLYHEKATSASEINNAALLYLQIGGEDICMEAKLDLLVQIMSRKAFHQLRTVEQLGYIVSTSVQHNSGVMALRLLVQSAAYSPTYLEHRLESFLASFRDDLEGMEEGELANHVQGLIGRLLDKDKNLGQETSRWWSEIASHLYVFDRADREVSHLRLVTKADLLALFDSFVLPPTPSPIEPDAVPTPSTLSTDTTATAASTTTTIITTAAAAASPTDTTTVSRRKLCIHIAGNNATATASPTPALGSQTIIDDVIAWKRSCPLWPVQCRQPSKPLVPSTS